MTKRLRMTVETALVMTVEVKNYNCIEITSNNDNARLQYNYTNYIDLACETGNCGVDNVDDDDDGNAMLSPILTGLCEVCPSIVCRAFSQRA